MKLLIAGGGTGGHVFPALEIAREWLSRPARDGAAKREVVMVGTEHGIETKLVPQAGLPLETIRAVGLKGIGGARFLNNAAMLLPAFWDSAAVLRRHTFVAALGVGGYASGPMMQAAFLQRIPTMIFEPNLVPGFTNRILGRMVTRVATAFPETARRWSAKSVVTGCPIRREFFNAPVRVQHQPPFRLLITGGSQGALPINRAVIDSLDRLGERKNQLFIVHQTGERDYNAVRVAYARREFRAEVVPFIDNMAEQFAQSDLIVCRAGAITVAEVAAAGRAAIFIPFGDATDSHQLRNAQGLQNSGAGRVIPQHELTPERLTSEIFQYLDQPQRISEVEQHARALARPRAAQDIVDLIEGIART
jgi:UDP-N-acetylglucosamine--N-acetylmuramyl-(pentapeptide) pyrophosphoryl-undecaprenol N-acetylglucosamine transferase